LQRNQVDPNRIKILITLLNTGRTPAYDVRLSVGNLGFGHRGIKDRDPGPVPEPQRHLTPPRLMVPNAITVWELPEYPLPPDTNQSVFVTARVFYKDILQCTHWIEVCRAYSGGSDPDRLGECGRGDETDREQDCRKEQQPQ
jgi:hypothetical protein